MVRRSLVPALTALVIVSGLVAFLSCEIDAEPGKTAKGANPKRPYKCCMAGYEFCPTTGTDGCECCGFSVTALLTEYTQDAKSPTGKLKIEGLEPPPLDFRVDLATYPNANKELPGMLNKSGKFILKSRLYEYQIDPKTHPKKDPNINFWHGRAFYCEGMGNEGGKMEDRTEEFIQGLELSKTISGAASLLEKSVPSYTIERDKDKQRSPKP